MRAEIGVCKLEEALAFCAGGKVFLPTTPAEMEEYVLEGYNKLLAKIYLAEAGALECFIFFQDTEDGELELKGVSDLMDAVSEGYTDLAGIINAAINALKFKDEALLPKFVGEGIELGSCSFRVDSSAMKVKEFVALRQEFFERLSRFSLLEGRFLAKITAFLRPEISAEGVLGLFGNNLLGAYLFLFFIAESVCGVKKNWIF